MIALSARLAFAAVLPLFLLGCLLTPGKFASSLRIDADRNFTFAYKGEVFASDMSNGLPGLGGEAADDGEEAPASVEKIALQDNKARPAAGKNDDAEAKNRAVAETLRKEAGYRSVQYLGNGKFVIDYSISGVLDHSFVYPFNTDAEILMPFIAVEVRANNTVRVRAPGFANDKNDSAPPGMEAAFKRLDGTFTIDTDAEIVSQNSEDGTTAAGNRRTISWRATPMLKDAPMAVLRVTPKR